MTLYFLGEPVQTSGPADDGWVWGAWVDRKGRDKVAWFWISQLKERPWQA